MPPRIQEQTRLCDINHLPAANKRKDPGQVLGRATDGGAQSAIAGKTGFASWLTWRSVLSSSARLKGHGRLRAGN